MNKTCPCNIFTFTSQIKLSWDVHSCWCFPAKALSYYSCRRSVPCVIWHQLKCHIVDFFFHIFMGAARLLSVCIVYVCVWSFVSTTSYPVRHLSVNATTLTATSFLFEHTRRALCVARLIYVPVCVCVCMY